MTSKRLVARAAVTLLLGLGALTGAHAQTVLKVSHFLPPGSNFQKNFLEPWCEKIAKDSADKLKCQIYPALQLGGTPVNMPVAQVTEGVSKGVIDGAMAPWEVLPATKIDEVVKFHMEGQANQPGFTQTPMALLMNQRKFDSLPADLKAVVEKNSGLVAAEWLGKVWDDGNNDARKSLAARGNKVLTIKNEDLAAIKKQTASVEADWIKQATARGLDGKKLAAEAHAIGAKYMPK